MLASLHVRWPLAGKTYMIETERPDLAGEREKALMVRWVMKGIDAERTSAVLHADPDSPVTIIEDVNWEINLLNHFIPLGIQRSRRWGLEEVVLEEVHLFNSLKEEIQRGG